MSFGNVVFTNKGRILRTKAEVGATLEFTKIGIGKGAIGEQPISELTNLVNSVMDVTITSLKANTDGQARIGGVFVNQGLASGFYWREIGLFARDPDEGEILYCYGNAGDLAEYIPSDGGSELLEKYVSIVALIGNASNVTASIDQSLVYATMEDLRIKVDKVDGMELSSNDYTTTDKTKLDGIEDQANNYSHPSNHPASIITIADAENNFTATHVEGALAEVKQIIQDTTTQVSQQLEVSSFHVEATSAKVVGTKKTDSLCWDGKCCYATTSSSEKTLAQITIDKLRFNRYSLIVRLRATNRSLTSGVVKVEVTKKNGASYSAIGSRIIKGNEFKDTSSYKSFYVSFEYQGPKATDNELKVTIKTLGVSSTFEVALDSISISLTTLGVFR